MAAPGKPKELKGDAVLYPYLARHLAEDDYWLSQLVTVRFITAFGIWLHPDTYTRLPILLPHVIRDATARKAVGGEEQWASPNPAGYLRDDNSLLKNIVKSLPVRSQMPEFDGLRIGTGWVASHIWQFRRDGERTTRDAQTNSFIPNLVWLPRWLSLLSDRQGSFVQHFLQAMSAHLYQPVAVPQPRDRAAEVAWSQLEVPEMPDEGLPPIGKLNYFAHDDSWCSRRETTIREVVEILDGAEGKHLPSRYAHGLLEIGSPMASRLKAELLSYLG